MAKSGLQRCSETAKDSARMTTPGVAVKHFVKLLAVALIFCAWACLPAQALDDTQANRAAQADYYLSVVPPQALLNDMTEKISATLPQDQRSLFKTLMTKNLDVNAVTNLMRTAMIKNFSADELKALADFYGSPVGKSAMAKMGNYMADAMTPLMVELAKAKALTQEQMKPK
jgi:hypothetical protein